MDKKYRCPQCGQLKNEIEFVIVEKKHICEDCDYNNQEIKREQQAERNFGA